MDLADARRAERRLVDGLEVLAPALAQVAPQLRLDLLEGEGLDRVLEARQFRDDRRGEEVRARGEDLAELDPGRAELREGRHQPLARLGVGERNAGQLGPLDLTLDLQLAPELELADRPAEPVAPEDREDLAQACDVLGPRDQGPGGRDDGAQDRHARRP